MPLLEGNKMLGVLSTAPNVQEQVVEAQKLVERGAIAISLSSQAWG